MSKTCAILLPAAGASSRMRGADKLLQQVGGTALLTCVAQRALQVTPHVAVSLRAHDEGRQHALNGMPVAILQITDAAEGMSASLRAGARWAMALDMQAVMIALPDMPDITAQDMRDLFAAQAQEPQRPLRACAADNQPGHPVILPRVLFSAMQVLRGDEGARLLLRSPRPRLHPLPGQRAVTDLDTPEDWDAWRKDQPPS